MTIQNQRGRTGWGFPPKYVEGQPAEGPPPFGRPYPYPKRRSIWTLAYVGDVGDGTYSATLELDGYAPLVVELEVEGGELLTVGGVAYDPSIPVLDEDDLADAWIVRLLELDGALEVVESATNDDGELTVVFRTPGRVATIGSLVEPAAVAQIVEYTVLGDPAGSSTITINGTPYVVDPTGKTAEAVRDEFVAALAAEAGVTPSAVAAVDKLRVTADVAGVAFTSVVEVVTQETITANVSIESIAEQIQAPIGQPVKVGRFLVTTTIDGEPACRLPEAGDTGDMIAGVLLRAHAWPTRPDDGAPANAGTPEAVSGDMITVVERCTAALRNAGDVAADTAGQVYVVAAGDDPGAARANSTGDTVTPTLLARWLEPTPPGELGLVRIKRQ